MSGASLGYASSVGREYHDRNPAILPLGGTAQGFLPGFTSHWNGHNLQYFWVLTWGPLYQGSWWNRSMKSTQ